MKDSGISNVGLFISLLIVAALLFYVAPKFLGQASSKTHSTKTREMSEPEKQSAGYVEVYHRGTSQAQAIVAESRTRYGN